MALYFWTAYRAVDRYLLVWQSLYYRLPGFAGNLIAKPIIGSAEALPILCVKYFRWGRERERYRDRRKWRHHCRAKIGDELTLSLAKTSHFSFLSSHFPSLPSEMVITVALNFAMSSHFRCQKTSSSLVRIFQMARAARRVIENLRQKKLMIKSCPVLHCSSLRKNESN